MEEEHLNSRSLEDWKKVWVDGNIGFHFSVVNPILKMFSDKLLADREGSTVFVPLCGKTLDMKWLYDLGHTVVGLEASELAVSLFFEENNLDHTSQPINEIPGTVHKSIDGRIRLYCCDLFDFSNKIEGPFDGIWDMGSLVAINKDDQQRYAELMVNLMNEGSRYLLTTFEYDPSQYRGSPYFVSDEDLTRLYSHSCIMEKIAHLSDVPGYEDACATFGVDYFYENVYLIKRNVTLDDWNDSWKKGRTGFHWLVVNQFLMKHADRMLNNRENISIFVPLCGKTLDMKWLSDLGHHVVGVEVNEEAVETFFTDHGIEVVKTSLGTIPGSLFKSVDGKIEIYCCDLFELHRVVNTKFNAVWDRASLVAMNKSDRQRYARCMKDLMADDCRCLLETLIYDPMEYQDTPRYLSEAEICLLYDDECSVETIDIVDSSDCPFYEDSRKIFKMSKLELRISLITKRSQVL